MATVIVEAAPDKVLDTVARMPGNNSEVKVTRTDATWRTVEFSDGRQFGSIQVTALGDRLSQLLVSSVHPGMATSTTSTNSTIVARILNVCKELGVSCQKPGS